jgi:hypothetical protein
MKKTLGSFGELADLLEGRIAAARVAMPLALLEGAELVKDDAQHRIGEYQSEAGDLPAWAPLTDATKADRLAKGFTEDDPLLRTGDLRKAIETRPAPEGVLVGVFDPEMETIAAAMEYGYFNVRAQKLIAPRSFIRAAAFMLAEAVGKLIGRRFGEVMGKI